MLKVGFSNKFPRPRVPSARPDIDSKAQRVEDKRQANVLHVPPVLPFHGPHLRSVPPITQDHPQIIKERSDA